MNTMRKPLLLLILLLALLATILPAQAESFQAVVAVDSMKVYSQKAPYPCLGELPRGKWRELTQEEVRRLTAYY